MLHIETSVYFEPSTGYVVLPQDIDVWTKGIIGQAVVDRDTIIGVCIAPIRTHAVIFLVPDDSDDHLNRLEICLDKETVTEFITALTAVRDNLEYGKL